MVSYMENEKEYRKKVKEWGKEARLAKKVFCQTCARQDFNRGQLKNSWTEYAEVELLSTSEIRDRKNPSKILGKMHDFKCPVGHGISSEILFPIDELGRPYDPAKKKKV